jgi:hypothetical protein
MVATTPGVERRSWLTALEIPIVLPGFLLAALMIWSTMGSIVEGGWADGIDILPSIALPALAVGLLFARMAWLPGWIAHPLALLLGVVWVVQRSSALLVAQVSEEFGPALASRLVSWSDYATELLIRAQIWLRVLQAGGRGEDILLFVITLAAIAWAVGYICAWQLFRGERIWPAVAICSGLTAVNYTFASPRPTTLAYIFLFATLLLIVFQNHARQQRIWRGAQVESPEWLTWRVMIASALFCALLVPLAAAVPLGVASTEAARVWQAVRAPLVTLRDAWQDAFSNINPPAGAGGGFITRSVRVGGARNLGTSEVMRIRTPRYEYWRAVAFDRYTGRFWQNTVGERARAITGNDTAEAARSEIAPGATIPVPGLLGHTRIGYRVEITRLRSDGLVVAGGYLTTTGLPVRVQHGYLDTLGPPRANFEEVSEIVTDTRLEVGVTYTATALMSIVDEQSLRAAGTDYPDWVRDSYLQLPDELPVRVRERAAAIIGDAEARTPYDAALAIQSYLRTLPYSESRPAPPENRDWVDYFLFSQQPGYCDDFAAAMVVLLRSEGIPARWVQGYTGGELDPDLGVYIVRENTAHSWPEVYFPGYGWQRFEPTPAPYARVPVRPATPPEERDGGSSLITPNELTDPEEYLRQLREENERFAGEGDAAALLAELEARRIAERNSRIFGIVLGVLVLAAAIGGAGFGLWWDVRGLAPAAQAYGRMTRLASLAGIGPPPEATPAEYAAQLTHELGDHQGASAAIERIVAAFVAERYRHAAISSPAQLTADLDTLRPLLLRRALARLTVGVKRG